MDRKEKFTPGKWRIRANSYCMIETESGVPIARTVLQEMQYGSPFGVRRGAIDGTNPERLANAALIVASPEMYEFLKLITLDARYFDMDKVEAILKKARGEE